MNYDYLFLPVFIGVWCLVCYLLSVFSGWTHAAKMYKNNDQVSDESWPFRSAKINMCNYSKCLSFGRNDYGLFIKVLFIFRLGSPTLFIPWEDVIVEDTNDLSVKFKVVQFKNFKGMKIRIRTGFYEKLMNKR